MGGTVDRAHARARQATLRQCAEIGTPLAGKRGSEALGGFGVGLAKRVQHDVANFVHRRADARADPHQESRGIHAHGP